MAKHRKAQTRPTIPHYLEPIPLMPDGIHVDFDRFFERAGYEDNRVYAQQQPLAIEVKVHRDEKHRSTSL